MAASGPPWWRMANAAAGLLQGGRAPRFDPETILAKGVRKAGSGDLGDGQAQVREGLAVWLEAIAKEGHLSPMGRLAIPDLAASWLASRLRLIDYMRANPAVKDVPLARPVVVVGFPRTGTTLLHHLLSLGADTRAPLMWELQEPAPPPAGAPDKRIAAAKRRVKTMLAVRPDLPRMHPLDAEAPEECVHALQQTLATFHLGAYAPVPSYFAWLLEQDLSPAYAYLRLVLQALAYGQPERRWVLKAPAHLFALDALLTVFPDACVVHIHRDPARAAASGCSLTAAIRTLTTEPSDPKALGEEWLYAWGEGLKRALAVREAMGPERFCDVRYDELLRDPAGTVRRVFAYFGDEAPPNTDEAVASWMAANPADRHGRHRYTLEEYGLRVDAVHQRFADYMQRFDLAPEAAPAG